MAMANYRVEQEDGTFTHYQFDDATDEGKAQLETLRAAVKNDESPVSKVVKADPEPFNTGGELSPTAGAK